MKTRLSFQTKRKISYLKDTFLPTRLFYRFLLIIIVPLFLVQSVGLYVFFDRHIKGIHEKFATNVARETKIALSLTNNSIYSDLMLEQISNLSDLNFKYLGSGQFTIDKDSDIQDITKKVFNRTFKNEYRIVQNSSKSYLLEVANGKGNILQVNIPYKRLYSSITHILLLWNGFLLILFLACAIIFMKNQIRPINRLAKFAEDFGRGIDNKYFKISGAKEVRQASSAFLNMRERITKQIEQRTTMLSGISHDLRTPLTRMKLELEMLEQKNEYKNLKQDIADMESMLDGYLSFAKQQQEEEYKEVDFNNYFTDIVKTTTKHFDGIVDIHFEQKIELKLKPVSFKRAITNIVYNAVKYANNMWLQIGIRRDYLEIHIDDDGKGIPEESREEVFKPFYRLEESRNKKTGGVGLGLSVARDAINSHGGSVSLHKSPYGGLRVSIRIPL